MKFRIVHLGVVLTVLALSGIVHGMWTNRWAESSTIEGKNLLAGINDDLGAWKPTAIFKCSNAADVPPNTRNDSRWFLSTKTGRQARATICSGSPGAVAVHTPDVCYLGAGWKIRGSVVRRTLPLADGGAASLWIADFTKTSPDRGADDSCLLGMDVGWQLGSARLSAMGARQSAHPLQDLPGASAFGRGRLDPRRPLP